MCYLDSLCGKDVSVCAMQTKPHIIELCCAKIMPSNDEDSLLTRVTKLPYLLITIAPRFKRCAQREILR